MGDVTQEIDEAEACIRSDFRSGKISREQFQKEMLIMARARHQELGSKPAPAPQFHVEDVREQKLAAVVQPDNGTSHEVLLAVLECAKAWVPEARIIGNVRAGDIARAIEALFVSTTKPDTAPAPQVMGDDA